MADIAGPRPRRPVPPSSKPSRTPSPPPAAAAAAPRTLPLLKLLLTLALLLPSLSYLIMDGDSLTFGVPVPRWLNPTTLLFPPSTPPHRVFTDAQLSLHDGRDPALPLLLALNGSVFDVSANPGTYGPGGGYNVFTGADAARGFVTGCFAEDRNWDLRGVEGMYLYLDEELDLFEEGRWGELVARFGGGGEGEGGKELGEARKKELRRRAEERRREAWERVVKAIAHWEGFFRNHDKYRYVGVVKHRDISGEPVKPICENALKKRPLKQGA